MGDVIRFAMGVTTLQDVAALVIGLAPFAQYIAARRSSRHIPPIVTNPHGNGALVNKAARDGSGKDASGIVVTAAIVIGFRAEYDVR